MNIEVKNLLVVGCEPGFLGGDEGHMGLSPAVEAAVDEAVKVVESLVQRILNGDGPSSMPAAKAVNFLQSTKTRKGD